MPETRLRRWVNVWRNTSLITLLLSVLASTLVVGLVIGLMGRNPLAAAGYFLHGAFGTRNNLIETLLKAMPLTLAGLGAVVAFRSGSFNVGIEGQLSLGALAGAYVGYRLHLPPAVHLLAVLLAGAAAGGAYGSIPGWLKSSRKVNEIISSIMLNYPAFYFTHWAVMKLTAKGSVMPATPFMDQNARLPALIAGTRLHWGLVLGILLPLGVAYLLNRTVLGYEMRAVGFNARAARLAGVRDQNLAVLAMVLSGALAGLAGTVEVAGVHFRLYDQMSPGYGFEAINVALVSLLNPVAVPFTALFFGALKTGTSELQTMSEVPRQVTQLYQGIILAFIAGQKLLEGLALRLTARRSRKEEASDGHH